MSQQRRDLLNRVTLCCVSTVKGFGDERLFFCLVLTPAPYGRAHGPARACDLSIGQPHTAPADHHVLSIVGRAGVVPHRSLFLLRLVFIRALPGFNRLGGRRLGIDGHLRIDYRGIDDGIRMRDGFWLLHHAGVTWTRRDLRP